MDKPVFQVSLGAKILISFPVSHSGPEDRDVSCSHPNSRHHHMTQTLLELPVRAGLQAFL